MFRRRLFRPRGPGPGRRPGQPTVPPMVRHALEHAQRAMQEGVPDRAARIYVRLADEAYADGRIRPGVQMDIEATRAFLAAQEFDRAQARALHALEYLLAAGRLPHRAKPAVERVAAAMTAQGDKDAAPAFRQRVEALLEVYGHSWDELAAGPGGDPRSPAGRARGRLPAQCPSCYAPLRSDEAEWVEEDRATCTYCGTIVLAS
ncbi:MAG: hypothetical protein MUQ30_01970 [Anaerolineae bacterium]|nr:hypothetical protein [Anaerolineae bacterium]